MYAATCPSSTATRRSSSFSPITAATDSMFSCTVRPSARIWPSSVWTSAGLVAAACATMSAATCWNCSFFATKSVSQFSSIIAPSAAATSPLLAVRSARFVALAAYLMRTISAACSKSPPASSRAFLESIIPAPVRSRSRFTSAALMFAIARSLLSSRSVLSTALAACLPHSPGHPAAAVPNVRLPRLGALAAPSRGAASVQSRPSRGLVPGTLGGAPAAQATPPPTAARRDPRRPAQ
jgi:hypothetical protein